MNRAKRAMGVRTRVHVPWKVVTFVSAICLIGTFALSSGPALAAAITPRTPVTRGSTYLALGDSVTFGYREADSIPTPNYSDPSSFLGYPELLGAALHLKVVNAACPGETSGTLIDASAQSNGCENTPGEGDVGYRTEYPLHVSYPGSQLNFAINYLKTHRNVRLVSLMIGANDFFLCEETTADDCASQSEEAAVADSLASNVATIVSAIRNEAGYKGQLAIVNYYSLDYASATDDAESELLNTTDDAAANPYNVEIANGYAALEAGAAPFGGNTCTAGLLTVLSSGGCGIHPSLFGQALLATAVGKAIRVP